MPTAPRWLILIAAFCAALVAAGAIYAQVEGNRGIVPVASTTDIEVDGIEVDVTGDSPEDARAKGWLEAQRKAWAEIGGGEISDGQLQSLVNAVVIERESVGPRRYIATLGVIFDRQSAGGVLGGEGERTRSAPMLLVPVLYQGGVYTVYETANPWQRVWAEYNAGRSAIDYVRPTGMGGQSLMVTYGQTGRRSRTWWRNILDEFGASDVIVPIARIERQWPGGPILGRFTARYGPDNIYLDSFALRAESEAGLEAMLVEARGRFDTIFTEALRSGKLRPDPTLARQSVTLSPIWQAILNDARSANRRREAAENARAAPREPTPSESASERPTPDTPAPTPSFEPLGTYVVQFATPEASDFDAGLASVRGTAGVRGAAVSSTAIGGVSVMQVTFAGDLTTLANALRARGWTVTQGSTALSIQR